MCKGENIPYCNRFVQAFVENGCRIFKVWKRTLPSGNKLTWFEQLFMSVLLFLRMASPSEHIKWWRGGRDAASFGKKQFVDFYVVIKAVALLVMALCACQTDWWAIVVTALLLETVASTLYPQFVGSYDNDKPYSTNRSIIFLFLGYSNLFAGFAVLYLWTGCVSTGSQTFLRKPIDALYFSCVTSTTLGYGEFLPKDGWSKLLVTLQTLSGFLLLALMLAVFVGMIGGKDKE